MPIVVQLVVGLLAYMFPLEVLAKIVVLLLGHFAKATTFTEIDDEVVDIMRERLGIDKGVIKDDTNAST